MLFHEINRKKLNETNRELKSQVFLTEEKQFSISDADLKQIIICASSRDY